MDAASLESTHSSDLVTYIELYLHPSSIMTAAFFLWLEMPISGLCGFMALASWLNTSNNYHQDVAVDVHVQVVSPEICVVPGSPVRVLEKYKCPRKYREPFWEIRTRESSASVKFCCIQRNDGCS